MTTTEDAATETPRIPPELAQRARAATKRSAPTGDPARGAKILAAGMSVAAGVGLVGAMAVASTAGEEGQTPTVPASQIIVIQQPVAAAGDEPGTLPAAAPPEVIVVETAPQAPVTQTEGS